MAEAIVTIKMTPEEHRLMVAALELQRDDMKKAGGSESRLTPADKRNAREQEARLTFLLERL